MQFIQLLFCLVALVSVRVHSMPVFETIEDNSVENSLNPNAGVDFGVPREPWVMITNAPEKVIRRESGSTLILKCDANGSPMPVITWFKDQVPLSEEDFENNAIADLSYTGMATVESKLIINNFQPAGRNIYTCFARSGPAVARTTTVVHTYHHNPHAIFRAPEFALLNEETLQKPSPPTIIYNYKMVMEEMGNSIVLPCKVAAYPKAEISWIFNDVEPVSDDGPRHKITSSGDLIFHKLSWADMGQYSCVARNSLGKDIANTFVYPLAVEN